MIKMKIMLNSWNKLNLKWEINLLLIRKTKIIKKNNEKINISKINDKSKISIILNGNI